jgi:hypothetical protein
MKSSVLWDITPYRTTPHYIPEDRNIQYFMISLIGILLYILCLRGSSSRMSIVTESSIFWDIASC